MMVFAVFLSCVLANAWNLQRFLRRVNQWERFAECVKSDASARELHAADGGGRGDLANGCKALAIVHLLYIHNKHSASRRVVDDARLLDGLARPPRVDAEEVDRHRQRQHEAAATSPTNSQYQQRAETSSNRPLVAAGLFERVL